MNSTDLNVRLTEILTTNETLEARFAARAELQAEALLQLPLSQRPSDPALVWDAVTQSLTEFAAVRAVPGKPAALLNQIVRRRVQDALRREQRDARRQTSLEGEDGNLVPEVHQLCVQPPAPAQITDTYDRILRIVDRVCAGIRPRYQEGRGYRLLQRLLLDGTSLDIAELRMRALEAGLNPKSFGDVVKRFRARLRSGMQRDPELQTLLDRTRPRPSKRSRKRPSRPRTPRLDA